MQYWAFAASPCICGRTMRSRVTRADRAAILCWGRRPANLGKATRLRRKLPVCFRLTRTRRPTIRRTIQSIVRCASSQSRLRFQLKPLCARSGCRWPTVFCCRIDQCLRSSSSAPSSLAVLRASEHACAGSLPTDSCADGALLTRARADSAIRSDLPSSLEERCCAIRSRSRETSECAFYIRILTNSATALRVRLESLTYDDFQADSLRAARGIHRSDQS